MGGTGKSPVTEYLIRLLQKTDKRIATLSRGYGRKSKGFVRADINATATTIGDEPLQFFTKFKEVTVAVCEDRVKGIQILLDQKPSPEIILLDDAYQHRHVKPGLSVLLTDYNHLYSHDCMFPSGRLRELRLGAGRADIIIVTKSPENISENKKAEITHDLKPGSYQKIFFSHIKYLEPVPCFKNSEKIITSDLRDYKILLFTGIARPAALTEYLQNRCKELYIIKFSDHHSYSAKDIKDISEKFCNIASQYKVILTTEKDFSRLIHQDFFNELSVFPMYYIPIEMDFPENDKRIFEKNILSYVEKNQ